MKNLSRIVLAVSLLSVVSVPTLHAADGKKSADYMPSLITETPLEGRMLAIKIVRKTIGTIQRDRGVKHAVRAKYQDDPQLLMRAAELVAMEFRTIARANNYWRKD